jgi:hypothetical protein
MLIEYDADSSHTRNTGKPWKTSHGNRRKIHYAGGLDDQYRLEARLRCYHGREGRPTWTAAAIFETFANDLTKRRRYVFPFVAYQYTFVPIGLAQAALVPMG